MTTSDALDRLRHELPRCAGIAWFEGAPLQLVGASGDPGEAWPSWDTLGKAAPALLRDGPVATPEVLLRWPTALVLLVERATGVVAVVMAAGPVDDPGQAVAGLAVVQARMVAQQVGA